LGGLAAAAPTQSNALLLELEKIKAAYDDTATNPNFRFKVCVYLSNPSLSQGISLLILESRGLSIALPAFYYYCKPSRVVL
jgi:hypothetical protein